MDPGERAAVIVTVEERCRSCGSDSLDEIIAFGETPLADRLLRADQLADPELRADLTFAVCTACSLAQIRQTVDPEVLFFAEYPYFSSVSPSLLAHFAASADDILGRCDLGECSLVIEAASNDGYMLHNFVEAGIPVLGIDPAAAPAKAANEAGIPTLCEFFGPALAERLVDEGRRCDVFLANNVLAHVPDLNGFVSAIARVLQPEGIAVIEVPYVVELIDHCEFDTIYHQHLCYFSVTALDALFRRNGLHLNDVVRTIIHGGSLRLFVQLVDRRCSSVDDLILQERQRGFDGPAAYVEFAVTVNDLKVRLLRLLTDVRAAGASIAGYGAAAKATTLLSYCGIDECHLDFVCDLNPYKHDKYMGGNRLPILPPSALLEHQPDYVLILAWNFWREIVAQNEEYAHRGGQFIVPIPEPQIVSARDVRS